jgi:hypothetical protein
LNFPRFYNTQLIEEISAYGDHSLLKVTAISNAASGLFRSIDAQSKHFIQQSIEEDVQVGRVCDELISQVQNLRTIPNPFVHATSYSIELLIYLHQPSKVRNEMTFIADRLKDSICQLRPKNTCSFMDLTSCQLIIGALTSGNASSTRKWFISKLRNAVLALKSRGWKTPLNILPEAFISNPDLVPAMVSLWKEIDR